MTDIPESYHQYGPEAAEILWKQHQLIAGLERDNDRLRADSELLRGANMELRGENVRLRAEVEALKERLAYFESITTGAEHKAINAALRREKDKADMRALVEKYKRGEGE